MRFYKENVEEKFWLKKLTFPLKKKHALKVNVPKLKEIKIINWKNLNKKIIPSKFRRNLLKKKKEKNHFI